MRAGIAALEGSTAEALVLYREAFHSYRGLSLEFDAALAGLDVATLLDLADRSSREVADWIVTARATLEQLGAAPLVTRLDAALAAPDGAPARQTGQRSRMSPTASR